MNDAAASQTATPPDEGWPLRKFIFWIAFAVALHTALIFLFATKKSLSPRAVGKIPHLEISRDDELTALENPALFARPNPRDFSAAIWQKDLEIAPPEFRYSEKTRELSQPENLGATFHQFMRTNPFIAFSPALKPPLPALTISVAPLTAENSTVKITGDLAKRKLIGAPALPVLELNDIIAPSRVQVLVDKSGAVVSAVLLLPENPLAAGGRAETGETNALNLAREFKFAPAAQIVIGEIIFFWHTMPVEP